jgi:small subunit ribosomal protein S8
MAMTDPIGDMLTRIRNGQRAGLGRIKTPASRFRRNVLEVLKREGYIRAYEDQESDGGKPELVIELKYLEGEPVIRTIDRVSTPGRRVYSSIKDLPRICNGLGIAILSTPHGVMSDAEAREANVGGEVLCNVI